MKKYVDNATNRRLGRVGKEYKKAKAKTKSKKSTGLTPDQRLKRCQMKNLELMNFVKQMLKKLEK